MSTVKTELERMARELPEDATWEDVQEAIYLRQVVERGFKDVKEGRVISTSELRKSLGLPS